MSLNSLLKKLETRGQNISLGRYLTNAIDEVTEKEFTKRKRKPSQYLSPSSIDGCVRQNYYKITGAPIDDNIKQDVSNCKKANSGTDRHERIQNMIVKLNDYGFDIRWVDLKEYVKVKGLTHLRVKGKHDNEYHLIDTKYNLSFRVDGLLKIKGEYVIIEIKTDDTYRFSRRTDIAKYHRVQGVCYSLALNINKVIYIYEDRNHFKLKPIEKIVHEEDWKEVVDMVDTVSIYKEDKVLPPKNIDSCKFCIYKELCSDDKNPYLESSD